jgi:hypothetical protein
MLDCAKGTFDIPLLQVVLANNNYILESKDMICF